MGKKKKKRSLLAMPKQVRKSKGHRGEWTDSHSTFLILTAIVPHLHFPFGPDVPKQRSLFLKRMSPVVKIQITIRVSCYKFLKSKLICFL